MMSVRIRTFGDTTLFLTADAGVTYALSILADLIGASPYSITYESTANPGTSPYRFNDANIETGSATFIITAWVTYDNVAAAHTPLPGPLLLLGVGVAWSWSRRLRRHCAQRQG